MPVKMICAEEEYGKCKDLKREDVGMLMDWASKQPHLPKISGNVIVRFVLFRNGFVFCRAAGDLVPSQLFLQHRSGEGDFG